MKTEWTKKKPTVPGQYWCRYRRRGVKTVLMTAVFFAVEGEKKPGWVFAFGGLLAGEKERDLEWWPERIEEPGESGPLTWKERALKAEKALAAARRRP